MAPRAAPGAMGPQPPEAWAGQGTGGSGGCRGGQQQQRPEQQEQSREAARHGVRSLVVARWLGQLRARASARAADLKVPRPGARPA